MLVDPYSHNLWPIEFIVYGFMTIPGIFGAYIGAFIRKRKEQNNSVFARLWRSKYQTSYGMVCFLLMYSLLLYVGSRLFFVAGTLCKGGKRWPSFLIVGLIILASSLLSKMFQNWLREKGNNRDKGNNGV